MPHRGHLVKQGRRFKTWRRRFVTVEGRVLKYYLSEGGQLRGEMSLAEGYVRDEPNATFGRANVAAVVTPERTLFIQAETGAELDAWKAALTVELSGRPMGAASGRRAPPPTPPMPRVLDIDGVQETGAELRVRAAGSLLEALCVAWYRVAAGAEAPARDADPAKAAGVTMLPGATLHTYTVTPADVGCRIGCSAHPATAHLFVNATARNPVAEVDPAALAARVSVQRHTHHKFCDRRVRVCTAEGRYREGERLVVRARGEGLGGHRIVWTRSAPVVGPDGHVTLPGAGDDEEEAAAVASAAAAAVSGADEARVKALAQARRQRIVRLTPSQLASLSFDPLPDRPLHAVPATPAAHESAPEPLAALSPPPPGPSAARAGPPAGAPFMPLELADVGCLLRAELRPVAGGPAVVSNAVGPVEPAPPRARLIWVEGAPVVGGLLLGRWLYFGGVQGPSKVSWIRVTPDGSSSVIKGPLAIDPRVMPPAPGSAPDAAADAHPCALRLSAEDQGCVIKCRVLPVRADGDEGHAEAARLRTKIAAAPDSGVEAAEKSATGLAPTVAAARAWSADSRHVPAGEASPHPWPGGVHLGGIDWPASALGAADALGV